jgi:type II secretory pathway pseudopilin PulG
MPPKRIRSKQQGQIIIEAVVAVGLVSVVLIALIGLSLRSFRIQLSNRQREQATQVERAAMEAIRQIRDGYGLIKTGDTPADLHAWSWTDPAIWTDDCPYDGDMWTCFRVYYDETNNYWVMERTDGVVAYDARDPVYRLHYDIATNRFGYPDLGDFPAAASASPFYRQILVRDRPQLTPFDPERAKDIVTILSWDDRSLQRQSKLVSVLSQWSADSGTP